MSSRNELQGWTIHPRALAELGWEACIVALGVARDLRSGVIPPKQYDQNYFDPWQTPECGTACCIAGWMAIRGVSCERLRNVSGLIGEPAVGLFAPSFERRRTPNEAADAVERYVYAGSEKPWRA